MTLSPDIHTTFIEASLLAIVLLLVVCLILLLRPRPRAEAEAVLKQLVELDRGLRSAIAEGSRAGLIEAFDRVQAGQEAQSKELARFGSGLKEDIARAREETAASLAQFGADQTTRLATLDETVRGGGAAVQAVLNKFQQLVWERLDVVRQSSNELLVRAGAVFGEIKDAVVAAEEKTNGTLAAQHLAVLERLSTGQLDVSTKLSKDLGELLQKTVENFDGFSRRLGEQQEQLRALVGTKLDEMRVGNETKLEDMRKAVDEKLQSALEKQIGESFARVAEQFAAVQQAIGQVQSVAGQVGDLKRLFSNVKSRGGWGEAQVEAMLQDMLPAGAYEKNVRIREGTAESVEFAIRIPAPHGETTWLPVDSKFPTEDYDRLLTANEAGNRDDEAAARTALAARIRDEAKRIGSKYIFAPKTVEFAILYLPSDSLYAEVARCPGLIELIRREHRIMVMGPSLLPAFLHTVKIGYMTVALERNATQIGETLAAVKSEWGKLVPWLDNIADRTDKLKKGIENVQQRARAVGRKLRTVDVIDHARAETVLGLDAPSFHDDSLDEAADEREDDAVG